MFKAGWKQYSNTLNIWHKNEQNTTADDLIFFTFKALPFVWRTFELIQKCQHILVSMVTMHDSETEIYIIAINHVRNTTVLHGMFSVW